MIASTVSIGRKHTTSFDMSWFARMFCVRVSSGGSYVHVDRAVVGSGRIG